MSARSRRRSRPPHALEALEQRRVLAASVSGLGELTITGSDGDDVVILAGGPGNGQVVVSGVPDVPDGTVFENVQSVVVSLGRGNDSLTLETNLFNPGGGSAPLRANLGFGGDTASLSNSLGSTVVSGAAGPDILTGGPGPDRLRGGRGNDTIFGGANNDILEGKIGSDSLFGNGGDDTLIGGPGPDQLFGNADVDILRGGTQGDALFGGAGPDLAFGNIGRDAFFVSPSEAQDFRDPDDNFNVLFNPDGFGVLLGDTFWERFAGAESGTTGIIDDEVRDAMIVLADAFPRVLTPYRVMLDDIFLMDTNQRQTVLQALVGVTNVFSPSVLANPAGFTLNDLLEFRDNLNAAAPSIGNFQGSFIEYNNALFDVLAETTPVSPGIVAVINGLEANASATQALLFGADGVFNLTTELAF